MSSLKLQCFVKLPDLGYNDRSNNDGHIEIAALTFGRWESELLPLGGGIGESALLMM